MALKIQEPLQKRFPWPPLDYAARREVTLADNWGSLAAGTPHSAMDLIVYNFDTKIPKYINWYMKNWMGCDIMASDQKNLRFGSTKPGKIYVYIPHPNWKPPQDIDKDARDAVVQVLSAQAASGLHFRTGSLELKAGELFGVATKISMGNIEVRYKSSLPSGDNAMYFPFADGADIVADTMLVTKARAGNAADDSFFVHEAIHASDDIRGVPKTRLDCESKAYIGQALYLRRRGRTVTPFVNTHHQIAWDIAARIDSGTEVPPYLLLNLTVVLTQLYTHYGPVDFDGA